MPNLRDLLAELFNLWPET